MGYRSEWQLAIAAADKAALDLVLGWMFDYSTMINASIPEEHRGIMAEILKCETERSDTHVMFGDNFTKCYPPWDSVVADIRDYTDANEELDMGYARIGEDYDDMETVQGDKYNVTPQIIRTVDGFDITIPEKKSTAATTTVVASSQPRQEEKCATCGRMKDVGHKCWCCGN